MIKLFSKEDVTACEDNLFQRGVQSKDLIEKAGEALALEGVNFNKIAIFSGGGKNGADGLCSAIHLLERGKEVDIYLLGEAKAKENEYFLERLKALTDNVFSYTGQDLSGYDAIFDCIFGIGLSRDVGGIYKDAIDKINASGAYIISADISSGLNANSGKKMGVCVNADKTVSFSGHKLGYYLEDGLDCTGETVVKEVGVKPETYTAELVSEIKINRRKRNTHKGVYGKISIISGSPRFVGAGLLAESSVRACMRSGAGLVRLVVPYSLKEVYAMRVLESTLSFLPDIEGEVLFDKAVLDEIIEFSDVIAIGMGLTRAKELPVILKYLVQNAKGTLIFDADALNMLSTDLSILEGAKEVILTPHLGEFSRLINKPIKDIDCIKDGFEFAKRYGVTLHLKGASSLTFTTDGKIYLTSSGTPALSKGGSGDVLSGIVSAFVAEGIENPVVGASIIHGVAGRLAEKRFTEYGTLARDVVEYVPDAIAKYLEK